MEDLVSVDLSTLRVPEDFERIVAKCVERVEVVPTAMDFDNDVSVTTTEDEEEEEDEKVQQEEQNASWNERPIYQLSPYEISWTLPRNEAKQLGKQLATLFDTVDTMKPKSKSRKPGGVKAGKGRRSGGYGIG
eukprot:6247031-Ditylum_brightwellii.AAC.1